MKRYSNIVLRKEKLSKGDKIFVAHSTIFRITSQERTKEESIKNINEAISLYLEEINN